jgi:hypothetical protein
MESTKPTLNEAENGNKSKPLLGEVFIYENESLIDLENEEWIDCIGFDGIYQVSNLGRIKGVERWRETRPGIGYMMKEKIRKQSVSEKHSSIRCFLCKEGKVKPQMMARLVFFSFNYNIKNLPEYFVMHKDNDWKNNKLENLKIGTQNEISKLTFENGKVEHLKLGNPILSKYKRINATMKDGIVSEIKCICCEKIKPIKFFRKDRNSCKKCDSNKWHFEKLNKKRVQGFEIKEIEIETGKITIYNNFNDKDLLKKVSIVTAIKYAESGDICKPKPQSKNIFKPFRLEVLKT